jgi:hypothetical protein
MMKSIFFFSILFFVGSSLSNASVNNGFYDVEFSSAPATSEVTTPAVEASMAPASAVSPPSRPASLTASVAAAAAAPAAPAEPTRDYTVRSAGRRAHLQEALSDVRSCNSLVFIEGLKTSRNRNDCDTLTTAQSFVATLMRQLPLCVGEGVRASGVTKPIKQTKVYNAGSLRTGRDNRGNLSLHFAARALDIWQIDVIFEDNTTLNTPMTVASKNRPFYKKFNACWKRETEAALRRQYPNNRSCHGYDGVIDCRRRDHHDHVHVSLPYCPKKRGYNSF